MMNMHMLKFEQYKASKLFLFFQKACHRAGDGAQPEACRHGLGAEVDV